MQDCYRTASQSRNDQLQMHLLMAWLTIIPFKLVNAELKYQGSLTAKFIAWLSFCDAEFNNQR